MERVILALALLGVVAAAIVVGRWIVELRKRRVLGRAASGARSESGDRILYFSTDACVQCREMQAPALERLRQVWPRPLVIERVDAIARADLAKQYGVLTVPSTVVFADGEPRGVNYGYATPERIARQLRGNVSTI